MNLTEDFYINQSRWKSYQDCDRLYAWLYVINIMPRRPRTYLLFGTAVHWAMEQAHLLGGSEEAFERATKGAVELFERSVKGLGGPLFDDDRAKIDDARKMLPSIVSAYRQHYEAKGTVWKPLGTEMELDVEVGEDSHIRLVGKIDNLVNFMNGLWLVDYKTMNKLDMREFMKYELDVQLTAYIYGGTKQLSMQSMSKGGKPIVIRGAIIDGIVKTQVPQFHREMFVRTIDDLRDFEQEFVEKAREIAIKHRRVQNGENWKTVFPKNTNHCPAYGGCAFRDLCVRDNETRRMDFTPRPPDYVDEKNQSRKTHGTDQK